MQIGFVRHAESTGNATGKYDKGDEPLTEKGQQQAEALVEHLRDYGFDLILCSPRRRAVQTILPYLKAEKRTALLWPDLVEACWHEKQDIEASTQVRRGEKVVLPEGLKDHFKLDDNNAFMPPHYETYAEGLARIRRVQDALLSAYSGQEQSVLVVGHYHSGSRLIEMLLGEEPIGRYKHSNCGVTIINQGDEDRFSATCVNLIG